MYKRQIEGFVNVVVKKQGLIKSKRGANLFTWLLGLVVFTSGTLSCMVTGSVARPVNDALKVPHEKAAFIVHTTSTPWCVLFLSLIHISMCIRDRLYKGGNDR